MKKLHIPLELIRIHVILCTFIFSYSLYDEVRMHFKTHANTERNPAKMSMNKLY